jgi:peptidyl-prolyl cis-trans isomerase B (cyclophilin B)
MKARNSSTSAVHHRAKLTLIPILCAFLIACDSDGTSDPPANISPVVSAGADQNVVAGAAVTLAGTVTDSDGTIASTTWSQSDGAAVELTDADTATASFTAPAVTVNTTLTFTLDATDDDGASASDTATVTVLPADNNRALLGPLVGANVVVTRVGNSSETLGTATTNPAEDLAIGGSFALPLDGLPEETWVLVTVTGGSDIDVDDDGQLDAVPTLNAGTIRALGRVSDWRARGTNVTALSEVAVRRLLAGGVDLDTLDLTSMEIQLAGLANELLSDDLDGVAGLDYRDVLAFTPADDDAALRPDTLTGADLNSIAQAVLAADDAQIDATVNAAFAFDTFATFNTTLGVMKFEMLAEVAPTTVANFTTHARRGFYDSLIFHRVIAAFVIQGGDPNADGTGGASILGGTFNDEFDESASNVAGTLAMANSGPNTNGSQFFVNVVDNLGLDFNKEPSTSAHTVFGRIVEGADVVTTISNVQTDAGDRPVEDVVIQNIVITRQ